jgi:biotin carboxyl carrier protein
MKIYLKNFDSNIAINITNYIQLEPNLYRIEFNIGDKLNSLFLKEGKTKDFYSKDGKTWKLINQNNYLPQISIGDQIFNIHFGFIPNQQGDDQQGALIAKMPGKVVKVLIEQGDQVQKGQSLLIIEAMKMENEDKPNQEGIVDKIHVSSGQSINSGDTLISIKNK